MILSICSDPDVLRVMKLIKIIITIIKIAVPIVLIVSVMLDYVRAMKDNDELAKTNKLASAKLIAAILVFFIPTFVKVLVKVIDTNAEYYSCIANATDEKIDEAYVERAKSYVLNAKTSLKRPMYQLALNEVNKLKDSSEKASLLKELEGILKEIEEAEKEREEQQEGPHISPEGKYSKTDIIDMDEQTLKNMTNQEFIEFMACAARIVYQENGGVLPSITIAQAILESGYGNHFEATSHNVFGLIGYPGSKPKVNRLRKFDNFYEATYYHYAYFENYKNVYGNFLNDCANHNPIHAASYLHAYAGGSTTYGPTIVQLINQYDLTKYDY